MVTSLDTYNDDDDEDEDDDDDDDPLVTPTPTPAALDNWLFFFEAAAPWVLFLPPAGVPSLVTAAHKISVQKPAFVRTVESY